MRSTTASWISAWIKARLVDPQDWPHQVKFMPATAAAATASGLASGKAISAFLPPSSSSTGLIVSAAARMTARPVGTLPMSATIAMPGRDASAAPTSRPPGSTLNTPGGNSPPISSARRNADNGACSGGLTMTLLPAASGAADLPAQNMNGWLNGMIRATTPRGSRTEKFTASGPIGMEAPFISVTSPAKNSICPAAIATSPCISVTGLPPSAASSAASSRPWRRSTAAISRSTLARSMGGTRRQIWKPCFAAAMAASTSATPPSAIVHSTWPVAGLATSIVRPSMASCHAPP